MALSATPVRLRFANTKPSTVGGLPPSGEARRAWENDVDVHWTVKFSKTKPAKDGTPRIDITIST